MNVTGVILAGGQSKRMGCDKAELIFQGKPLIEHTKNLFNQSNIQQTFISGELGIPDKFPNKGPIGGILSCLLQLKSFDAVLFLPVDMPLINKDIINQMLSQPFTNLLYYKNYHLPIIIKNTQEIRQVILAQLKNNALSIHELISQLRGNSIESEGLQDFFINTNTPQQWQRVIHKLAKQEP
jgi:molybdopterin-guanine dinucleotide biosynthesis protein A